jgi:hypothetical protein
MPSGMCETEAPDGPAAAEAVPRTRSTSWPEPGACVRNLVTREAFDSAHP